MAAALVLDGPRPQRRWTIALRWLLALPHFVVLLLVGIITFLVLIGAWCSAIVLGRLPRFLHRFLGRVVTYATRVNAYSLYLLTDTWPPFATSRSYAVDVELDEPQRLNRLAVLFRFILGIPAWLVLQILSSGVTVVMVFLWLLALITGRLPDTAWFANAAVLRYQTRAYSYLMLLTPEQPSALHGDPVRPPHLLERERLGLETAVEVEEPGDDEPAPMPRLRSITLQTGARRLVTAYIVLGIVFTIAGNLVQPWQLGREAELARLERSYDDLNESLQEYGTSMATCPIEDDVCFATGTRQLVDAFGLFETRLQALDVPAAAQDERRAVFDDIDAMVSSLQGVHGAADPEAFDAAYADLQDAALRFDEDVVALYDAIAD